MKTLDLCGAVALIVFVWLLISGLHQIADPSDLENRMAQRMESIP